MMTNEKYEEMRTDLVRIVTEYAETNMGLVRRDRDAIHEGWDPKEDPESGYLFDEVLLHVCPDADMDDDDCMDMYSCLIDAVADLLVGEF